MSEMESVINDFIKPLNVFFKLAQFGRMTKANILGCQILHRTYGVIAILMSEYLNCICTIDLNKQRQNDPTGVTTEVVVHQYRSSARKMFESRPYSPFASLTCGLKNEAKSRLSPYAAHSILNIMNLEPHSINPMNLISTILQINAVTITKLSDTTYTSSKEVYGSPAL